jgi:hypothetical protein
MTTSGCRAPAERRAGKSTVSGSIAARGLRGMRFGSPVFVFPAGLPFGEDRCAIAESATPR